MARRRVLKQVSFAQPAEIVARELIGKYLVRRLGKELLSAQITETEAYVGPHDLACHGRFGCTKRTAVMFGPAGFWYVYLIYGMYWMLNVVTDEEDYPAAVLFRAAGPWTGPGKLTRGMSINKGLNGTPAFNAGDLWIEDRGEQIPRRRILRTPRIGIDYAGDWKDKLYRYVLKEPKGSQKLAARPR